MQTYSLCGRVIFLVGVTGFEPAKSLAPKASALPSYATPRFDCGWTFTILPIHGFGKYPYLPTRRLRAPGQFRPTPPISDENLEWIVQDDHHCAHKRNRTSVTTWTRWHSAIEIYEHSSYVGREGLEPPGTLR